MRARFEHHRWLLSVTRSPLALPPYSNRERDMSALLKHDLVERRFTGAVALGVILLIVAGAYGYWFS